jgi:hypothetical protein
MKRHMGDCRVQVCTVTRVCVCFVCFCLIAAMKRHMGDCRVQVCTSLHSIVCLCLHTDTHSIHRHTDTHPIECRFVL